MTDNNPKNSLESKHQEDNYYLTTAHTNPNNVGIKANSRFTTKENLDSFSHLNNTRKKTNSDYFLGGNSYNNNKASNEYEETNLRREIPTERCDSEYLGSNNAPNFSYNSRAKQNMTFTNPSRENLNSNTNANINNFTNFNNTFTAPSANNHNIPLNNFNNFLNSNTMHNNNNNNINNNSINNNLDFLSKLRNNYNPAEIAELESSKGIASSFTHNFPTAAYTPSENFNNNLINNNNHNNNNNNNNGNNVAFESSIASELRLSNLERRLENTEKILHFYDEMLRLKEEERRNEVRIDKNKIAELSKKINLLEENQKFLNKKLSEQSELLNEKIDLMEKKFLKFLDNKNSIGEFYAGKLAEFENLYKKSEAFFETKIDEKVLGMQNNFDAKLEDVLNLIHELTQQTDKNDFNVIESRESIRNIQNDHVDFLKIVTILKEKADTLDYIMEQITDLKQRYHKIINLYGVQQLEEEDKAFNRMINDNNVNSNANHFNSHHDVN